MKRIIAAAIAFGMFLPLIAAPASCDTTTLLKAFVKPECLAKAGLGL